jgi:phospholipase/carboxylesterase
MNRLEFVHRFAPATAGSSRVLLLLHGTGGDETDLLPLGRELDKTAALLSPRGKVSENGIPRFFRRFAEGVFDEEDVIRRANELADFVAAAAEQYGFDAAHVTAVGYSNGANIAAAMMLLRPLVLRSAVLLRAMMPLSNPLPPDLSSKRVLLLAGDTDPIIPAVNVQQLAALLRLAGAEVQLEIQRAGHALIPADLAIAKEWLHGAM